MRLINIQILRALAAYLVVFFHMRGYERRAIEKLGTTDFPFFSFAQNGMIGVDMFFVISGFIMVYVTAQKPSGPLVSFDFLLARIFRIYPVWIFFALAIAGLFFLSSGSIVEPDKLAKTNSSQIEYLLKSLLLWPQRYPPVLAVGWTLIHEMYFYLIFSLILLAPKRTRIIWLAIWACIVITANYLGMVTKSTPAYLQIILSPLTLEFLAGAFAGWLIVSGWKKFATVALALGAISFLYALNMSFEIDARTFFVQRVLWFTPSCVLLIYGAAAFESNTSPGLVRRSLARLGDWSYSLYLAHMFAVMLMGAALRKIDHILHGSTPVLQLGAPGILDSLLFGTGVLTLTTLAAAISYHLLERPSLHFLNTTFRRKRQ